MKLDNILSVLEKAELAKFVENKVLTEAVKKVVLSAIYYDGTLVQNESADAQKNFCLAIATEKLTNEELGAKLKASLAGVQLLENGFAQLSQFKAVEDKLKQTKNTAR